MTPPVPAKPSYNPLTYRPSQLWKAFYATAVGFGGALVAAAADGHVTLVGWVSAAVAGLVAGGGVFGISNK